MDAYQHHTRVRVLPHIKSLTTVSVTSSCASRARANFPAHRARSARADRGAFGDIRGPGRADAVLAVREEGRRGRSGGEPAPARARAERSALIPRGSCGERRGDSAALAGVRGGRRGDARHR